MIRRALSEAFQDPDGATSMTRICAFGALLLTAFAVFADRSAETVGVLMGGGVVALLTRNKPGADDE
jgi:hypothetical protein